MGEYQDSQARREQMNSINTRDLTQDEVNMLDDPRKATLQTRVASVLKPRGFTTQTIALFVLHAQLDSIVSRRSQWKVSEMVGFFLRIFDEVQRA